MPVDAILTVNKMRISSANYQMQATHGALCYWVILSVRCLCGLTAVWIQLRAQELRHRQRIAIHVTTMTRRSRGGDQRGQAAATRCIEPEKVLAGGTVR